MRLPERPAEPVAVERDSAATRQCAKAGQTLKRPCAKVRDLGDGAHALRDDLDHRDKIVRELRNDIQARGGRVAELETKARVASLSFGTSEAKLEAAAAARPRPRERVQGGDGGARQGRGRRAEVFRARRR